MQPIRRVRGFHRVKNSRVNVYSWVLRFRRRQFVRVKVRLAVISRGKVCCDRAVFSTGVAGGVECGLGLSKQSRVANVGDVGLRFRPFPLDGSAERLIHRVGGDGVEVLHIIERSNHERQACLGPRQ